MGIEFNYDFYVHQRDVHRFLTAVAELCDPQKPRPMSVVPPEGGSFDLSLCFPVDEPLRAYRDDQTDLDRTWPDGSSRIMVGYIYLHVRDTVAVLPDHWMFSFTPAVTDQSKLFLMSPSIRETFATLALSTGASLCLIENESGGAEIIVTALGQRVSTWVPGPCLLWRPRGHPAEAFEELSSRLAGQPPAPPRWIIGPEHPEFPAEIAGIADYARVASHHWAGT